MDKNILYSNQNVCYKASEGIRFLFIDKSGKVNKGYYVENVLWGHLVGDIIELCENQKELCLSAGFSSKLWFDSGKDSSWARFKQHLTNIVHVHQANII